jgi:nucleoside-diphosphate-sugar epimerase|tara:strand:+ start:256 stop:1248 length:993 start_codon:yes stop_codon:yes gene_type:complete
MKKKILVSGAGGFIGGHLVSKLMKDGFNIVCADIKPFNKWFQIFEENLNHSIDLKDYEACLRVTKNVDYVFNLSCNMGGMGFIENNKAECMLSVLINTNLLRASHINQVKKFLFSSSACVYNIDKQKNTNTQGLREDESYPAYPEDGYGWEKLFSERMCRHFKEDFNLDVRIVRLHNVYGHLGTYSGGREKAPAAICRKIAEAKINNSDTIDVWGDGEQTRSFMFIDDCIEGLLKIFNSDYSEPINLGSTEQVSINNLVNKIETIANYKINKNYLIDKPKGVRGRSSDNSLIKKTINWEPNITLSEGLKITYEWIFEQISSKKTDKKFSN